MKNHLWGIRGGVPSQHSTTDKVMNLSVINVANYSFRVEKIF